MQHAQALMDFDIECATDFDMGLVEQLRLDYLESGKQRDSDASFKSMVRMFPFYLKEGIIGVDGQMKGFGSSARGKDSQTSSLSQNSGVATSTMHFTASLSNLS
jgi:hypothetical protein